MFSVTARLEGNIKPGQNAKSAVTRATSAFIRRQGDVYLRYMTAEAPVGATQKLSRSHILRIINQFRAEIANTASYAAPVHEGSRPHMPPESSGLPYPVRLFIAQHGTRPNPWMTRAAEMGSRELGENAERLAAEIAEEMFRG